MKPSLRLFLTILALHAVGHAAQAADWTTPYNVVWDSPSKDAHGSMPLGNGDVGVNVWVEPSGDVIFYLNKTDAWDENGRLCKIGRVRVKLDPPLAVTSRFRQELRLREGLILIDAGQGQEHCQMRLWVDAQEPVVRVETESAQPRDCRAEVELWRLRQRPFGPQDDSHSGSGLSANPFKPMVLPDAVAGADVVAGASAARVTWYHRDTRSIYPLCLKVQHLESLTDRFADPLLDHTFGASLQGEGMLAAGPRALKSSTPAKRHALTVCVLAERAATADHWLTDLHRLEETANRATFAQSREATAAWWDGFWNRSWVLVEENAGCAIPANGHAVTLGADPNGGNRFAGQIAGPAIHGRALGAEELSQRQPRGEAVKFPQPLAAAATTWPRGLTLEAWLRPAAHENGRIFDKSTPARGDGFLFDTHPGLSLRLIVGEEMLTAANCLKAEQWQHVAATVDPTTGARKIYVNGEVVAHSGGGEPSVLTRGYVLQRFMNAAAGRGAAPIKFNGSMFTVEATPGASPNTPAGDPDWRMWGSNYWFQNTRLAYWPMLAAGDFDLMQPWFHMFHEALPLSEARMQCYYKFPAAAAFPETMYFWGLPNNGDYGWGNTAPEPANGYIRRYWNGGLELTAAMLDRYDFTQDEEFARNTLVPLADPLVSFFDQYWPRRDAKGKRIFDPAQSLETWHVAVNPLPEIAGLRFLLPRLLALPQHLTSASQRGRWTRLLAELPPVPVAEVGGVKLLRPAETFSAHSNSENTELYAVFPFRLYGVGRPELAMARATYERRGNRHNHGWCQDSIQAACLGLGDEAGRLVESRAAHSNPGYRFPAMWGPNFDWVPDQDHGNNILTTLHCMLLQAVGDKLYLFPAWPKSWNASFKLHAPRNTVVEGTWRDGKLGPWKVTPESRRKDVVLPE